MDLSKADGSEATEQSTFGTCSGVIRPFIEVRRSPRVILMNFIAATVYYIEENEGSRQDSTRTITKNTTKALNIKRGATETQVSAYKIIRGRREDLYYA